MEPPNAHALTNANSDISKTLLRETGKLTAFVKARVRNAADAEDILRDVFFEFVQAYRLPESIEQVSAWLLRVARNRIIDRFRRAKASPLHASAPDREDENGPLSLELELPGLGLHPQRRCLPLLRSVRLGLPGGRDQTAKVTRRCANQERARASWKLLVLR